MPEFYPSIGEAVGADTPHNIRLAGGQPSAADAPHASAYRIAPSADPPNPPTPTSPRSRSPRAKGWPVTPPTGTNRAEHYGTDVEIWHDHGVFADTRTGIPEAAHQILWEHGFALDTEWLGPNYRVLTRDDSWAEDKACATRAAEALTRAGFTTNLDPILLSRDALAADHAQQLRRQHAATRTSLTSGVRPPGPTASPPPSDRLAHRPPRPLGDLP